MESRPVSRGEVYVVVQLLLIALVILGPRSWPGLGPWPAALARISRAAGIVLMVAGAALALAGLAALGPANLTPLPRPRARGRLVRTGAYRLVRHPIYAGGIALAFGWALTARALPTLIYAAAMALFADFKATREERWLRERFPDYPDYARRVRKLIPFVH
jgi:protein-S-isoprenylcysteine O-methyltransferase Ste14